MNLKLNPNGDEQQGKNVVTDSDIRSLLSGGAKGSTSSPKKTALTLPKPLSVEKEQPLVAPAVEKQELPAAQTQPPAYVAPQEPLYEPEEIAPEPQRQRRNPTEVVRETLGEGFVEGLTQEESIEITDADLKEAKKRYVSFKIRKTAILSALVIFMLGMVALGSYQTFGKKDLTGPDIAALANYYNGDTNFPTDGLQGFLSANVGEMISSKLTLNTDVTQATVGDPVITKVTKKNSSIANVYFYVDITSTKGTERVNCVLAISYDKASQTYYPAGDVILTSNLPANSTTKKVDNPFLSFDGIAKATEENQKSSETFINNFFQLLYSGQDVTPYYKSDIVLLTNGETFKGINMYMLYSATNKNGYNVYVQLKLALPNGVNYTTDKYMTITKSGQSWMVTAIL